MKEISVIRTRLAAVALTTAVSTILAVSTASAAGFALNEQSTTGTGMAYAGVAAGGTLSDMYWNPATLGDVKGFQTESDFSGILPLANVTTKPFGPFPGQNDGTVTTGAIVPASYMAYRLNQNIIFGLGINSPFGLSTSYSPTSYLNMAGIAGTTRIFSLDVNPNVAYQFNDQFTIAVGLQGQYMEALESSFSQPSAYFKGSTKSVGIGYTLGVDWKPMVGTKIGIGYRSGISNTVNGSLNNVLLPSPPFPANTYSNFAGNLGLKTPGILALGVAQDVGPQWTLRAGFTYTNWSVLSGTPVSGPAAAVVLNALGTTNIPFKYKDSWMASTGAEYKWDAKTTLRAGIAYETSPIVSSNRSFRLPDSDRIWFSTGISYDVSKQVSFDLGYSFLDGVGGTSIPAGTSGGLVLNGPASGSFNGTSHILSAALKVKFD